MVSTSKIADSLREVLSCPVSTAAEDLARYGEDFGRLMTRQPAIVVHAASGLDIAQTLRVAREYKVPVSLRGAGHSSGGHTLCEAGIVIANQVDRKEFTPLEGQRVEVTAWTRWSHVEAGLNARGETAPVLTTSLDTSPAGTLSTGGYGPRSLLYGAQADNVERLELIRPDGSSVWCSWSENAELMRFTLSGLGQVGVIERAILRTQPRKPYLSIHRHSTRSLRGLMDALAWASEHKGPMPDHFYGAVRPSGEAEAVFMAGCATEAEASAYQPPAPLAQARRELKVLPPGQEVISILEDPALAEIFSRVRNAWCDYGFDLEGARRFAEFLEEDLLRDLADGPPIVYLLMMQRPPHRLAFDLRPPRQAERFYCVGVYYLVPPPDLAALERVRARQRRCLEKCLALGGRPYLYGVHGGPLGLSPAELEAIYGEDYRRMRELRRQADPLGLFNPGAML